MNIHIYEYGKIRNYIMYVCVYIYDCACTYIHNIVNICNLNVNIYIYNQNGGGRRPQGHSWATSPAPRQRQSRDLETNPRSKAAPTPFVLTFPSSVAHSKCW